MFRFTLLCTLWCMAMVLSKVECTNETHIQDKKLSESEKRFIDEFSDFLKISLRHDYMVPEPVLFRLPRILALPNIRVSELIIYYVRYNRSDITKLFNFIAEKDESSYINYVGTNVHLLLDLCKVFDPEELSIVHAGRIAYTITIHYHVALTEDVMKLLEAFVAHRAPGKHHLLDRDSVVTDKVIKGKMLSPQRHIEITKHNSHYIIDTSSTSRIMREGYYSEIVNILDRKIMWFNYHFRDSDLIPQCRFGMLTYLIKNKKLHPLDRLHLAERIIMLYSESVPISCLFNGGSFGEIIEDNFPATYYYYVYLAKKFKSDMFLSNWNDLRSRLKEDSLEAMKKYMTDYRENWISNFALSQNYTESSCPAYVFEFRMSKDRPEVEDTATCNQIAKCEDLTGKFASTIEGPQYLFTAAIRYCGSKVINRAHIKYIVANGSSDGIHWYLIDQLLKYCQLKSIKNAEKEECRSVKQVYTKYSHPYALANTHEYTEIPKFPNREGTETSKYWRAFKRLYQAGAEKNVRAIQSTIMKILTAINNDEDAKRPTSQVRYNLLRTILRMKSLWITPYFKTHTITRNIMESRIPGVAIQEEFLKFEANEALTENLSEFKIFGFGKV